MHSRNVWVGILAGGVAGEPWSPGNDDARGVHRGVRRRQRTFEHLERAVGALGHARRPEGRCQHGRRASPGWWRSTAWRPKNAPIRMNADPVCLREVKGAQFQETFEVGSDGKSLGERVRVREGRPRQLRATTRRPSRPRSTRRNAGTIPHVFGMRVGQPLEILNSDPTLHNIHATAEGEHRSSTPASRSRA